MSWLRSQKTKRRIQHRLTWTSLGWIFKIKRFSSNRESRVEMIWLCQIKLVESKWITMRRCKFIKMVAVIPVIALGTVPRATVKTASTQRTTISSTMKIIRARDDYKVKPMNLIKRLLTITWMSKRILLLTMCRWQAMKTRYSWRIWTKSIKPRRQLTPNAF